MFQAIALIVAVLLAQVPAASPAPAAPSPGDLAFRAGDFDGAMHAYVTAVAANPSDPDAVLGLGTMDLYKNDLDGARAYLEHASKLLPGDARVQARLRTLEQREPHEGDYQIAMHGKIVTIPFVATEPLPIVRAKIDGQDVQLFLDTGAPGVDLTADAAQRLHLTTKAAGMGTFAGGRTAQVQQTRIDTIEFDNLTVRGIDSDVLPSSIELGGRTLDGAIGTGFLAHFLASIDYVHGRLILRPRSASDAFEGKASGAKAAIVPMWLVGDHFLFARAHVNDAPEALFNIDTGGAGLGVQLTKAQLELAKITPDTAHPGSFAGGGGTARAVPFLARSVSIGTFVQHDLPGLYFPDGDQYGIFPFAVGGTISHLFFHQAVLTFDFEAMQLIVSKE
jgi:predicted aspartyl protease